MVAEKSCSCLALDICGSDGRFYGCVWFIAARRSIGLVWLAVEKVLTQRFCACPLRWRRLFRSRGECGAMVKSCCEMGLIAH